MKTSPKLTFPELEEILGKLDTARVGLIGDLCLDLYWIADMKLSELSRETPHYPLPVVEERSAPGGAGNVACNIAALAPAKLVVVGLVGKDWRGNLLKESLQQHGVDDALILQKSGRMTSAYIKPLRTGISDVIYEDPRLDFEERAPMDEASEQEVLQALEQMASQVDVICVSDQMKYGIVTDRVREALCELGRQGKTVVVDSRDRAMLYHHVTVKPNEVEAARAFGGDPEDPESLSVLADEISRRTDAPALITLGEKGCIVAHEGMVCRCEAYPVEPPIDFCGAGDTFLSGFGASLASGFLPETAAKFANLCSAVTIKKCSTTGTATREELLRAARLYL